MTLSVLAIANADINRQYASVGVIRTPDTAMIIVELLDSGRGPLEMVPLSDITLTAPSGLVVGDGPYFFGANGDIQQRPDMPLSRAFAKVAPPRGSASEKRARAAFINVPNGEHTLQVTAAGAAGTWARATVAVRAAGGATVVEARLPT
jgi:hypothetical protein